MTTLYYNPITKDHQDHARKHPECPERIEQIINTLKKSNLFYSLNIRTGHEATIPELLMVHSPSYVKMLHNIKPQEWHNYFDDIFANTFTLASAKISVGMSIDAASDILLGNSKHSVVLCRPPGHHAHYNEAAGFCIFNNVVFAAKLLSQHHKVLIFDWDVHHGDGTSSLVNGMKNVKLVTVQRTDNGKYYPGTGNTNSFNNIHSIGFNEFIDGKGYRALFNEKVLPLIKDFKPTTILISAGFDTALGDPLGNCSLEENDYKYMTDAMLPHCENMIAFLEGGYYPKAVGTGIRAVIKAMNEFTTADVESSDCSDSMED